MSLTTKEMGVRARMMLCDSAVVAENKLYLHGAGWNIVTAPTFPCIHPRIGLGLLFEIPWNETNEQHRMVIELVDEDGQPHMVTQPDGAEAPLRAEGAFTVGRPPQLVAGDVQIMPFAMNMDQIRFTRPGAYDIIVRVDGEERDRLTFRVMSPGVHLGG